MRKLLDIARCETQQSIQVYELRLQKIKRSDLNSWKFWVRWRATSEFRYLSEMIDLLYRQKLRILDLIDKYEIDPIS